MKTIFKHTLLLIALLTFFACNEKDDPKNEYIISDWYPIELWIYIQDQDGKDLLDYDSENYIGNDFMLTYKDKTYRIQTKDKVSKVYKPEFDGLVLVYDNDKKKYSAYFGELEGYAEYNDDFTITWKDGSKDIIHFYRKITGSLDSDDKWLLNGEDTKQARPYGIFTMIK
jgi:hypothetical protein